MIGKLTFISAGAGSGKTHRLTNILHAELSSGSVRPSGVIATTFTRKAATELRERVRSHLLGEGERTLANAMGQARIGTVNSVCGGLLERFAFEAGLAPRQQVLEEAQAAALVSQAVDAVRDGPGVAELLLIARRLGIEEWRTDLKDLLEKARANDIDPGLLAGFAAENARDLLSHFPQPTRDDLSAELIEAIASVAPALAAANEAKFVKVTDEYVKLLRQIERHLRAGTTPWSEWVKLSKSNPSAKLVALAEPVRSIAARFAEHPLLHADIAGYLERLFRLCAEALTVYAWRKRESGVLDFTDQEHLLLKVLDDPLVAATLGEELDLLLVDEFQDTSPIQLALFLKLAGFAKSIYWVGDIKQAIYGFRGSDTALMGAILNAIPALGGAKEILGSSWRSRKPLVDLVNEVFVPAFSGLLAPQEVELSPERNEPLAGPAFANWMLGGKNNGLEVCALAAGVRKLVESGYMIFDKEAKVARPVRFADIAILCRANDGVKAVAAGLRQFGIPTATAQPGLLATPEAVFALACLRRLSDPSDTVATAEIVALADCPEPETWVVNRLEHLADGGDEDSWLEQGPGAHVLVARLAQMRKDLPLLAPREALQAVITECELPGRVLRWKQNPAVARVRLANLEALVAIAAQYEDICRSSQHAASISGLMLWLYEKANEGQDALAAPAIDAIKVITHHGAKGLEWPVVILMDLDAKIKDRLWGITATSRAQIAATNPLQDRFLRFWPWPFGKLSSFALADELGQTRIAQEFRAAAIEETKRLLYVTMTRARDLLIIARSKRTPTGECLDALNATWLLPAGDDVNLVLPSGVVVAAEKWELDPAEPDGASAGISTPIHWFKSPSARTLRLPLLSSPSSASPLPCTIAEKVRLGQRIATAHGVDMERLGSALHACIAGGMVDRNSPLSVDEVGAILAAFDVEERVEAQAVLKQIRALQGWITSRWGDAPVHVEIPVEMVTDAAQIVQGRIDLLIELPDGWILIDHKSNPQGIDQWDSIAAEHAGQLAVYREAIERGSGKPVVESWLFMVVSGGLVRLEPAGGN